MTIKLLLGLSKMVQLLYGYH